MSRTASASVNLGITQPTLDELLALRLSARQLRLNATRGQQHAAGNQKSHIYGRGMDYAESRMYQAGDDIRRLDWRLTARSGKLHTKLFQEDRQSQLVILLDTHATMQFGTQQRFKSVQAARAAALAAWLVSRQGEQVGLISFGDHFQLLPPAGGNKGVLALCHRLTTLHQQTPRHLAFSDALLQLKKSGIRAGRLLLISDGLALTTTDLNRLRQFGRHAAMSFIGIADPLEAAPAKAGNYAVSIKGKATRLALFGRRREDFFQQLNSGQQQLQQFASHNGIPYRQLSVADHPASVLPSLLGRVGR